jgi:hypothetical protein
MPIAKSLGEFFEKIAYVDKCRFSYSTRFRTIGNSPTHAVPDGSAVIVSCSLIVPSRPDLWCEYYPEQPVCVPAWVATGKLRPPTT